MANTWLTVGRMSRRLCSKCQNYLSDLTKVKWRRPVCYSLMISTASAAVIDKERPTLEAPDPSKLTSAYLIKKASSATTDAAHSLITQVAMAQSQAEKEYSEAVFALIVLMEYRLQVLDHTAEEARISDLVLEARALVTDKRKKKQDMEMLMVSVRSLVNSAAEVAFLTGEDLSAVSAGEILNRTELYLKQVKLDSSTADMKLREIEAKTITVEAKHAEEMEKKKTKVQTEKEKTEENKTDTNSENTETEENKS